MVLVDLEQGSDDGVFRKIRTDFDSKGVQQSDHQIRRNMDELMARAVAEVKASG